MKPFCCRFKLKTLASVFIFVDLLRGMLGSALLFGLFCGMSAKYLENLDEEKYVNTTTRVDHFQNREIFVGCICVGIAICVVDILMALALDNILNKNLGKASLVWMNCSLLGIILRCGFYAFVYKYEQYLGLDRLEKLTPKTKLVAHILFTAAVAYEGVKVAQLITGVASQMEFQGRARTQKKKQVAPRRVVVGIIGGSKRSID